MITKDNKSSPITNRLITSNSSKNELLSENYSKLNHSLVTSSNNKTKIVSPAKVIELDEKNANLRPRKRSINPVIMNDIKRQRRQSQLLAKKLTLKGQNADDKEIDDVEKKCHFTLVFDPNGRFSYWIGKKYYNFFYLL